jgi:hypothetical protein
MSFLWRKSSCRTWREPEEPASLRRQAGIITYKSGPVKIENRSLLEEASCECYGVLIQQVKTWRAEVR